MVAATVILGWLDALQAALGRPLRPSERMVVLRAERERLDALERAFLVTTGLDYLLPIRRGRREDWGR